MKQKKEVQTFHLNNDLSTIIQNYIDLEFDFTLSMGKYSAYIEFGDSLKEKYLVKEQTVRTFIAYNKILSDLKRPEVQVILSDLKDSIDESKNNYFTGHCKTNIYQEKAVCVDLNSAYLQALFNLGLIQAKTFLYFEKLTKSERLVAVGMLAKQKQIYEFRNGKEYEVRSDVSEYRFVFNALVQEINDVMSKIANYIQDDFIFFWVDGIYLKNEYMAFMVEQIFMDSGYPCKIEYLTEFRSRNSLQYMEYSFLKDGHRKSFMVPIDSIYKDIKRNLFEVLKGNKMNHYLNGKLEATPTWRQKEYEQKAIF